MVNLDRNYSIRDSESDDEEFLSEMDVLGVSLMIRKLVASKVLN